MTPRRGSLSAVPDPGPGPRGASLLTCRDCGMPDPPPEKTCMVGGWAFDHRVGTDAGCRWCGRLKEACRRSPCTRRGVTWRSWLRMKARARVARWRARREFPVPRR